MRSFSKNSIFMYWVLISLHVVWFVFSDIWTWHDFTFLVTNIVIPCDTQTHTCPQAAVDLPKLNHNCSLSGDNDLVGATYSN